MPEAPGWPPSGAGVPPGRLILLLPEGPWAPVLSMGRPSMFGGLRDLSEPPATRPLSPCFHRGTGKREKIPGTEEAEHYTISRRP